ncbi:MAG TPA: hypothetical protein VEV45_19375 [Streptosporangiaceae bacterium]|nr:hypothetical protein [Streptosporangiaceae bacterium]
MTAGRGPRRWPLARPLARRRALADPGAFSQPDRARPQHAAQLARPRRVHAIARAQREVLVITRYVARRAHVTAGRTPGRVPVGARASTLADAGNGEPVVRVGPRVGLRWVAARCTDPLGQLSKLVPAPLTDGRERY